MEEKVCFGAKKMIEQINNIKVKERIRQKEGKIKE